MSEMNGAIAIVGMSLRFPKANTQEEFWNNLLEGRDCARMLDKEELAKLGVAREKLDSAEYVYRSYDLDDIDMFDAKFFGFSPREARMADPQLRIMLEAAQECIEDSGHVVNGTKTGMYFGVADHKYWMYYNLFQSPLEEQNEVAKRIIAVKDFFATQLSHKLGLTGPSISLNSACSTGLLATHEACNHLLMYDCDYALAGGCEILKGVGYQYFDGGLSAKGGYLRAFDKDASGTVFGSGVGMVMLRRLEDAVRDGDKIYAVIRSTAVNNDGNQKVGYMAPGVKGQMSVIHEAIERAGVSARDISYVEAHGTGTNVGDPIEIESISKVYRKYTDDKQYCTIGSVKTNVGHLSIAAGIAGLIKTSLMLYHRKIPKILHFNEANPAIDFENSPFKVARELSDWTPYNGRRIAGISAFGVGGTNVHAVLEEAPAQERAGQGSPYDQVFVLGARSDKALADVRTRLADFVERHPETAPGDIAFTLNAGRQKFEHRLALRASNREQLIQACRAGGQKTHTVSPGAMRQTVFMFPGQGAQYPDMGLQLYLQEPRFKAHVDACCAETSEALGIDIFPVLFPTLCGTASAAGAADAHARINQTEFTQICLFVVSVAMARLWIEFGVRPDAMVGHSIGEYAAACVAGVFSLEDGLKLVAHRGRLMQSMPKGSMLSVQRPAADLARYLGQDLSIAGINSPASCVVSGTDAAIEGLGATLAAAGIKSTVLHTSHAFHSHMMDPILEQFEDVVRSVALQAPRTPFISNLTGTWITADQATDPGYWSAQLRAPVLFSRGLACVVQQDSVCLEMGPGASLCALLGQHDFDAACHTVATLPRAVDEVSAADFLAAALGTACCHGVEIDWEAVYAGSGARRVSLPTYPFERKSFWLDDEMLKPKTVTADLGPLEHPLLGRRVATSSKVVVFENLIDKDTPKFLADHRLIETVIFPGAGYTQMALEAGKYFIKNKKVRIDEIRFAQVMMLHDGAQKVVQVVATASGDGCTFEILSRNAGEQADAPWVLHAKGKISPHSVNAPSIAMPALAAQPERELVPLSRYYDALKFITFGPSFRCIKRLWIGENAAGQLESLGLVELPQHLYGEVDRYSFHPVLLDAAFQIIDGPKISQTGTLPVGLRNFTVYEAVPNAFYVHAVRREQTDEEYSIGEITVFSEKGSVIARIEHYLQKEIADSVVARDQLADVLFDIDWQQTGQSIARPATAGAWIVAGAPSAFTNKLAAALEGAGRQVLQLDGGLAGAAALELVKRSQVDTIVFARALADGGGAADAMDLSLDLLRMVQQVNACEADAPPRIVIGTRGAQAAGGAGDGGEQQAHQAALWGIGNTLTAEHPELRCLRADLDAAPTSLDAFVADLVAGDTLENQLAYRDGQRLAPRLQRHGGAAGTDSALRLPNGPFEVRLMRFGTFDNFAAREFIPDLVGENEVLVEMHSAALNFKETLYVLGFLNPNKRHAANFDFGMEGAGRIKRVGPGVTHLKKGDDVIVWHNGCLSSDFVVNVDKVIRKPAALSYAEAACLPTVFMTAYHALYNIAGIKRGDKVLIHAAAGGVGQVAIQIARAVGAEVFATASQGKWEHLRAQGVRHVFDSRTLEFSRQVMEATGGAGVDIVFNSLNGEFIERSFDAMATNGRFVEIGKKDIWSNERAAAYRPDVDYTFFEIGENDTSGGIGGDTIIHDLMQQILDDFESGKLAPLPMTEYAVSDLQQAYRYLAAGKNVGKVVVNFDKHLATAAGATLVRPDRTYLVTGGLGGLGFECANWLIGQGARHIALAGRSAPTEEVARRIADLAKIGVNAFAVRGDIGVQADAARIIDTIAAGPAPLGGILHCAGVLEDGVLAQQTPEKFAKVFGPKVMGTLHLHHLTASMALDFFVCFSSVSAILDGGGQGNYAAANAFMDRLMSLRRSQGLAGLSVNWGAWADVGMAARLAQKRTMDMSHFISREEGFLALERLMAGQAVQGVVCKLGARLAPDTRSRLLLELVEKAAANDGEGAAMGDLERVFAQHPGNGVAENFALFLKSQVNRVLGADARDEVDADTEFVALGVDSLSMTELKNAVEHGMGKPLKMATFFANPTVGHLSKHLAREYGDLFAGKGGAAAASAPSSAAPAAAAEAEATARIPSIDFVAMGGGASERPIFCLPGLNGNIFDFNDFAATVKHKYRVMVGEISSELATLETDIATIAADAVAQIKRIQPAGPYALLGYSYGGVVSLEVAHQLRGAGDDVDMLMMLDSFPHFHYRLDERFMSFMSALIVDSILTPMKFDEATYERLATQIMHTPGDRMGELMRQFDTGGTPGARVNIDLFSNIAEAGKKRSLATYAPPKNIDGVKITYVRAGSYPRSMSFAQLDGFLDDATMRDEKYSWGDFVGNDFEVHRVAGQHNELLKPVHVDAIVGLVDRALGGAHQ
ncbi:MULTISPECIES: type I polyketide synthase [unclassified Massilia]|uniref:type I polyketide synthase n=1 Tax=unclassified Massilia TaxID=2609279 RepID=UPI00177C3030|nr:MULTISPECIES: type I polyketide synthase [unclassified Massilia]MBD8529964.1 SDR family NAD(P)-dependent oxidoreductase [Massilia sp. CFBP 13647]MBD8673882.1 SDR family NAD(P)-dependent oxidoreductase [Massilia sp. CFBP 13721]